MATDPLADAALARSLLERAVAWQTAPALTAQEVTDLLALADTAGTYGGTDLNRAASLGWQWKAGRVTKNYAQSLGDGVKFSREQVYAHCMEQAAKYATGELSVLGTSLAGRRRSGIGVVGLVSTMVDPAEVG